MPESLFLRAISDYLEGLGLVAAGRAGVAEPEDAADVPSIVLSLESIERINKSLGERSEVMEGALRVTSQIDLANPVLVTDADVDLVDEIARVVQLPHGGLVQSTGAEGALSADDLTVSVAGQAYTVVPSAPQPNQLSADPLLGRLSFGNALPATGMIEASYFVGRWERRSVTSRGVLRVDVCAGGASGVETLSDATLSALGDFQGVLPGLHTFSLYRLGPITRQPPDAEFRRRTLELRFDYEATIDRPDASGGIIRRVRVQPPAPVPAGSTAYEPFEAGGA